MPRISSSYFTTPSGTCLPRFWTSRRTQRSPGRTNVWKIKHSPTFMDRSALTVVLKPSAVRGTNISLTWAVSPLRHDAPYPRQIAARVRTPWNVDWGLILPFSCRSNFSDHKGARGGAIRHATQRPGHVSKRHAPMGWLGWGSGFRLIWTHGWGFVCPTWLLWVSVAGYYRSIRQPTLGLPEFPAAWGN
jgi:hypothetical protein